MTNHENLSITDRAYLSCFAKLSIFSFLQEMDWPHPRYVQLAPA
ncbi:hypothetical protein [Spirosoma radiotolerans]|nr:hypothetical protein [Spirosoma radiotolerans]